MDKALDIFDRVLSMIQAAGWLSVPLLLIGGFIGYWQRGQFAKGEIAGLKAQITARDAQLAVRDERKLLADERLAEATRNLEALKAQVAELQAAFKTDSEATAASYLRPSGKRTGATGPAIEKIATTTEALSGSLDALRLGIAGDSSMTAVTEILRAMHQPAPSTGNGL